MHRHLLAAYADGIHSEATGGSPRTSLVKQMNKSAEVMSGALQVQLAFQSGGPSDRKCPPASRQQAHRQLFIGQHERPSRRSNLWYRGDGKHSRTISREQLEICRTSVSPNYSDWLKPGHGSLV